jgi:hypothetical protein
MREKRSYHPKPQPLSDVAARLLNESLSRLAKDDSLEADHFLFRGASGGEPIFQSVRRDDDEESRALLAKTVEEHGAPFARCAQYGRLVIRINLSVLREIRKLSPSEIELQWCADQFVGFLGRGPVGPPKGFAISTDSECEVEKK